MNTKKKIAVILIILAIIFAGVSIAMTFFEPNLISFNGNSAGNSGDDSGTGKIKVVVEPPAGGTT